MLLKPLSVRQATPVSLLTGVALLLMATRGFAQPADDQVPLEAAPEAPAPAAGEEAPSDEAPAPASPEPPTEAKPKPKPQPQAAAPAAPEPRPELPATAGPTWPDPTSDAGDLAEQGDERPKATKAEVGDDRVFAEEWWQHTRPMLNLGGYFRVRGELFHKFSLNRRDPAGEAIWPRPSDDYYQDARGNEYGAQLCTPDETGRGSADGGGSATENCRATSQAGANLRFRINPQLLVSENLSINAQIDMLDNLVLGSTRAGLSEDSLGSSDSTAEPRGDSIVVRRAWGEYATPVGELRFGRMPSHWGLGIFQNSGDGYDDDYQSTVDRIQFVSGLKSYDLYFGGSWDFGNEGHSTEAFSQLGEQAYDSAQLDDLDQYVLSIFRRRSPQLEPLDLAKENIVVNGGLYVMYQHQVLAAAETCGDGTSTPPCGAGEARFTRRGANVFVPDVWLQVKYDKFRFEVEALTVQGKVESVDQGGADTFVDDWRLNQWAVATEIEQLALEDKLKLQFGFGWASGDGDLDSLTNTSNNTPAQLANRTQSMYRFHPAHRVDLILHRHLLKRVQGTYYFRPSVDYDFVRDEKGQRLGGGVAGIWTRASHFMQTPGHERDLGIELNASLYFQSKDGVLNDDPNEMGGFFSMLQYGVLFPLDGLGYRSADRREIAEFASTDIKSAQTLRLFLGVLY